MPEVILRGQVVPGTNGAGVHWPLQQIQELTGRADLVPGTLNVRLDQAHRLRPEFLLRRECRVDRRTRPEDLAFESCFLLIGGNRLPAFIARTSTNFHGDFVLEIMAATHLRDTYGLADGDEIGVAIRVWGGFQNPD